MTDEDLMLLAREGDREAFSLVTQRYRGPILNFIYRMVGDSEVAEDLSQDTFVRLWLYAKTYVPSAKLSTFLFHIARNLCRDHLEKCRRRPPLASLSEPTTDGEGRPRLLEEEIRDPGRGPQGQLSRQQLAQEVEAALLILPEDQRTVFVLTEFHGLPYQAVAQIVGCPVGTVASRKSAALKLLRNQLSPSSYHMEGSA
jgi:RNA polymerase sigma-70 factor (ECF subfamily)